MKMYGCKICKKKGDVFTSDRKAVRKHLMEVHGIKGVKGNKSNLSLKKDSQINLNMIEYEWT